jgi:kynureninase
VDLLLEAGMERLRDRSVRLSEYFLELWDAQLAPLGFRLNSPRDPARAAPTSLSVMTKDCASTWLSSMT